jgi:hypothetical protein
MEGATHECPLLWRGLGEAKTEWFFKSERVQLKNILLIYKIINPKK